MSVNQFRWLCWAYFGSMLISIILEGAGVAGGHHLRTVINDLSPITWFQIGNLLTVPVFNLTFFRGVYRLLTWDYNFYTGFYQIFRYLWLMVFSGAAAWGIATNFTYLYGQIASLFRWVANIL